MAVDIYGRTEPTLGGVFVPDSVTVTLGNGIPSVLIQNMQIQYSQPVSKFFELGGPNVYYVGGRPQGNASLGRIVGPTSTITTLYNAYGNICNAQNNIMQFAFTSNTCGTPGVGPTPTGGTVLLPASGNLLYSMTYCVLTQIGMNVNEQDMIVRENAGLMFAGLTVTNNGVKAGT